MLTHFVFGAGVVSALAGGIPYDLRWTLAIVLSLTANMVVDELGHVVRKGFVSRSPLTHSIFTAPVWGGAVGYAVWWAGHGLGLLAAGLEWPSVVLGVVVAGSHLLLDSLTERGVFVLTNRVALAHFGARNFLLNAVFVLIGIALFLPWTSG